MFSHCTDIIANIDNDVETYTNKVSEIEEVEKKAAEEAEKKKQEEKKKKEAEKGIAAYSFSASFIYTY